MSHFSQRQSLLAVQIVDDISNDLGVRLQRAPVTVHLDPPSVGVIRGNLSVVDDRIVEKGKRMGTGPPSRCVGRITAVDRPTVTGVFIQLVESSDVLRITDRLEHTHVLPAGKHVGVADRRVDVDDASGDEFVGTQLTGCEFGGERGDEVSPNQGFVGDPRVFLGRDFR